MRRNRKKQLTPQMFQTIQMEILCLKRQLERLDPISEEARQTREDIKVLTKLIRKEQ